MARGKLRIHLGAAPCVGKTYAMLSEAHRRVERGADCKERIFEPFQRHDDAPRGAGVGPGRAVARGFAEAMGGTPDVEDTPGGGLTKVLTLRAAGTRPELHPAAEPERQAS